MRFLHRTTFLSFPNGDRTAYVPPCGTYSCMMDVPSRDLPVTHSLRLVGEPDYFWKWRREASSPYGISMVIDDALTRNDTYAETYALAFDCQDEPYDRNAWIKLSRECLTPGVLHRFTFPAKAQNLTLGPDGQVAAELEIYRARDGRHPDDTYDAPDQTITLTLPEGTYDWTELEQQFTLPQDTVAILVHIGIRRATGKLRLGSPRLYPQHQDTIIPPYDRQQGREPRFNYLAENISRRDWLECDCKIDGNIVYSGTAYTSIFRRPDIDIPLGSLTPGPHELTITLHNDYDSAVGFVLQQLDLVETGNHDCELVAAPEYVEESRPFAVLIKTAKEHVTIHACGKSHEFALAGLHALKLPPLQQPEQTITLSTVSFSDTFTVIRTPPATKQLYLSTGDSIFIRQTPEDMLRFIEWYMSENIGNALTFRHSYRWGGGRCLNPDIWNQVIPLLNDLGMHYSVMVDGRELPSQFSTPPEALVTGPNYLGRQAHENDGAFYYWGNNLWQAEALPQPYADILARTVNKGGIQPHVRPKRNGDKAWWFFDPTNARNMHEAAEAFVRNLMDAKGESTRHSGPSVLFRYFFQAGYDFLLSEQMYGPEEVILASLRGASKAYGANGFGAHLATQWSSTPHDTPEHAERYFLSLATCYLQGVTQINTEEGLYRMESGYVDHDRFSQACVNHRNAHRRFNRFMQTHPRNGNMVVPIACIQGRDDGWSCFSGKANVWMREGRQWAYGDAEASFDLLHLFYPRSALHGLTCCPCPVAPQGWYTGTPYGPVDLIPVEADWSAYRAVIFLGWNTYRPEDGKKMLDFVRQGGTLLLSKRHLSAALEHNAAGTYADDLSLHELLGTDFTQVTGILRRACGKGKVIFFAQDCYPANQAIHDMYQQEILAIAQEAAQAETQKGWIHANEDVNFAAYDQPDGTRIFYLLNIRWWDHKASDVSIQSPQGLETIPVETADITVKELPR